MHLFGHHSSPHVDLLLVPVRVLFVCTFGAGRWLRHILASRRRDGATREAVKAEKRRRRAERKAKGKDAMSEDGSDSSDEEEEKLPVPTLQDRLLQAQIEIAVASNQSGQVGVAGDILRNEGLGSIDGVRCRLHSVDRLQGIEPCVFINLFAGGYSIDGEKSGRVYDHASKEFLAGLDRGKIPARKLLDLAGHSNFVYHDGCLLMGVRDFRMPRSFDQKPTVWTMVLGPDSGSLAQDLSIIAESHQNLNSDDLLLVEMRMLLATQPAVCLNPTPHVAVVASSLHRRANRMDVWHARPARSAFPQFRRTFDTGAMRRLHAAVHVSNIAGLEPAAPSLAASSRAPASEPWNGGGGSSSPRSTCKGVWKDNRLLEGWDLDGDGKDGAMMMATALRMLKASACTGDREVFTGAKSSHGTLGSKRESRLLDKTASEGGSGGERGIPRNYYVPRQYLRDGQPPERQMRFRKENQIVTIAIENKGASTYQLRSWLHEFGPDGKQLDNGQVHMPPQNVGNSHQARLFGGQLVCCVSDFQISVLIFSCLVLPCALRCLVALSNDSFHILREHFPSTVSMAGTYVIVVMCAVRGLSQGRMAVHRRFSPACCSQGKCGREFWRGGAGRHIQR